MANKPMFCGNHRPHQDVMVGKLPLRIWLLLADRYSPEDHHYTENRARIVCALLEAQRMGLLPQGPVPGQASACLRL
jgi:hypothetical protein